MNSKVTLPELTEQLAADAGCSKRLASDFLHEFFLLATEALEQGESVRIKGIGTFKLNAAPQKRAVNVASGEEYTVPEHSRVSFVPSKELAAAVNDAFETFQAVELAPSVDEQILSGAETDSPEEAPVSVLAATSGFSDPSDISESADIFESSDISDSADNTDIDEISDTSEAAGSSEIADNAETSELPESPEIPETSELPDPTDIPEASDFSEESDFSEYESPTPRRRFGWGFLVGFASALIALLIAGAIYLHFVGLPSAGNLPQWAQTFIGTPAPKTSQAPLPAKTTPTPADTLAQTLIDSAASVSTTHPTVAPTAASDAPAVYDTISTSRFLTTMAREHYGNFHLWPYIYKANADALGHPDRIRPGTRVVIPNLRAMGIDPKSPETIAEAKREGTRIYARYK